MWHNDEFIVFGTIIDTSCIGFEEGERWDINTTKNESNRYRSFDPIATLIFIISEITCNRSGPHQSFVQGDASPGEPGLC